MDPTTEITTADAAKVLGVSARHVLWYHAHGHLPGRRIGERVLVFRRDDVEKLAANKPKKTGRPKVEKPKATAKTKKSKPAPKRKT